MTKLPANQTTKAYASEVERIRKGAPAQPSRASIKASADANEKIVADTARYEALAREHGADLSEEGFNEALRKIGRTK